MLVRSSIFVVVYLVSILAAAMPAVSSADAHGQKAVLVTGASSGIGRNITERLAGEGFFVYAGARKARDLEALDGLDNVKSVRLDVTVDEDIDAAVRMIEKEGRGLFGIVNNAGVAVIGPMNEASEEDILWVHDVNVLGPYRINKAFAPLLEESKGRTMIIGSISGFISGPGSGTYSMSKFAVEAYTESLAAELADKGVTVTIVEPGGYRSKIREKVALQELTGAQQAAEDLTAEQKAELEAARARNAELKEPDEVSDAVLHALTAETPKPRYMVVPNAEQADATIRNALRRVVELNADQEYEYSREELIAMLDELL